MKKIRVALIGYGRSGRNIHRKLLLQLPDKYEFVTFVEQDKERREMIERENGMQALNDYRELFGRTDIDLVINASFPSTTPASATTCSPTASTCCPRSPRPAT